MKASNVVAPARATKEAPDLEEAFEQEDEKELIVEAKDDDEIDIKKDKYIKQPKKKAAAQKGSKKRSKLNEGEDEEIIEPKNKKMKVKSQSNAKKKSK